MESPPHRANQAAKWRSKTRARVLTDQGKGDSVCVRGVCSYNKLHLRTLAGWSYLNCLLGKKAPCFALLLKLLLILFQVDTKDFTQFFNVLLDISLIFRSPHTRHHCPGRRKCFLCSVSAIRWHWGVPPVPRKSESWASSLMVTKACLVFFFFWTRNINVCLRLRQIIFQWNGVFHMGGVRSWVWNTEKQYHTDPQEAN